MLQGPDKSHSAVPGEWPATIAELPLVLTEPQFAHLLDKSVRTLQRWRRENLIPFTKVGKTPLYARDVVLTRLGVTRA